MKKYDLSQPGNSDFGKMPTDPQKLGHVMEKMRLGGILGQQGSNRILFDTVNIANSANPQTLEFFTNTSNKSPNFTNWQKGQNLAGESVLITHIWFSRVVLSGTDLTLDTTSVTNNYPMVQTGVGEGLSYSQATLEIANSNVLINYPIMEILPWNNIDQNGVTQWNIQTVGEAYLGHSVIRLEARPAIPPTQGIRLSLRVPPVAGLQANSAIVCGLGRFGSVFSAKNTL